MPMSFPDMESLKRRAEIRMFRNPIDGETEAEFRDALADHVKKTDVVEAHEIRSSKPWDDWDDFDHSEFVRNTGEI